MAGRTAGKKRFSIKAWRKKFARFLKPENAYFDLETGQTHYRGAPYCLCCRLPVMDFATVCADCQKSDHKHPYDGKPLVVKVTYS